MFKLFKRKKNNRKGSIVSMPKAKRGHRKRSSSKSLTQLNPFTRTKSGNSSSKYRNRQRPALLRYMAIFFSSTLVMVSLGFIMFSVVKLTINLRQNAAGLSSDGSTLGMSVTGFDEVPQYPSTEYVFDQYRDEDIVRDFASSGQAAYRLPLGVDMDEVYEFYANQLPEKGWELVRNVELGNEEMAHGQYWVKDGVGLRIYSRINDVWYEKLSVTQAESGLSDEMASAQERDLIISTSEGQNLLPNFPWHLRVPDDYVADYLDMGIDDRQGVRIFKIGNRDDAVYLVPLARDSQEPWDLQLRNYIQGFNDEKSEDSSISWSVESVSYVETKFGTSLEASLKSSDGATAQGHIIYNDRYSTTYFLTSYGQLEDFRQYVWDRLQPK